MKICGAQTKPVTGDIQANIERHLLSIDRALSSGADVIIFSELSLTGYEPSMAKELSTRANDQRLDVFQKISDTSSIAIGVGVPTKNGNHVSISMILFQPNKAPSVYSKKYLHPDEDEFFVPGVNFPSLKINDTSIGIAICYELSIPEHFSAARESGADVYIASVAKFAKGVENAVKTLSDIATIHSIPVFMVNAVGTADNGICTGNTSVWNSKGQLAGQLGSSTEGLIVYDTVSEETVVKRI
jgi:predicted amidohydrolase